MISWSYVCVLHNFPFIVLLAWCNCCSLKELLQGYHFFFFLLKTLSCYLRVHEEVIDPDHNNFCSGCPSQLPTTVLRRTNLICEIRLSVQMGSYISLFFLILSFFLSIFRLPDHQHCPGCIPSSWGLILSSCDVFLF